MSDEFDWDGLRAAFANQREQIEAIRAALTRPDVAALLRGEAVAVPKIPTDDMVWDALEVTQEDFDEEPHGCMEEAADFRARWARALAASPFAKEGKE